MNSSAKSVLIFGIYIAFIGLTLLLIPNLFLTTIGMPTTTEVWIRLCGILIGALSVYYIVAAYSNLPIIFKVTVFIRCSIIVFFSVFIFLHMMEPIMLVFGFIDFAGGSWRYYCMKKEAIWS